MTAASSSQVILRRCGPGPSQNGAGPGEVVHRGLWADLADLARQEDGEDVDAVQLFCSDGQVGVARVLLGGVLARGAPFQAELQTEPGTALILPDVRLDQVRRLLRGLWQKQEDDEDVDTELILAFPWMDWARWTAGSHEPGSSGQNGDNDTVSASGVRLKAPPIRTPSPVVTTTPSVSPVTVKEETELCCPLCPRRFPARSLLHNHLTTDHTSPPPPSFGPPQQQEQQQQPLPPTSSSSSLRPGGVKCPICGKLLSDKHSLRKHEDAVHFNIRPHGCDICQKRFAVKNDLKEHVQAVHNGIKACICDICGLSLSTRHGLRTHKLVHQENSKAIRCVHLNCTKTFRHMSTYRKHIARMHDFTPDKRLKCDHCGKLYNHKEGLDRHVKKFHSLLAGQFRCAQCPAAFAFNYDLNKHLKKCHQMAHKSKQQQRQQQQQQQQQLLQREQFQMLVDQPGDSGIMLAQDFGRQRQQQQQQLNGLFL